MEGLELVSFKIISAVGMAKSSYIEAIRASEQGDFDLAMEKIKEGQEYFNGGHSAHSDLIQQEASGNTVVPSLLLMHAEDQLMATETIKLMALEMIKLTQRLYTLENQK